MDAKRRLVYGFLALPHDVQHDIAEALGLLDAGDGAQPAAEFARGVVERARERRRLSALWDAVESQSVDPIRRNPFAGL